MQWIVGIDTVATGKNYTHRGTAAGIQAIKAIAKHFTSGTTKLSNTSSYTSVNTPASIEIISDVNQAEAGQMIAYIIRVTEPSGLVKTDVDVRNDGVDQQYDGDQSAALQTYTLTITSTHADIGTLDGTVTTTDRAGQKTSKPLPGVEILDNIPPYVVGVNATDTIAYNDTLNIVVSESVQGDISHAVSFTNLETQLEVPLQTTYNDATRIIQTIPQKNLLPGRQYRLGIKATDVTDANGNPLDGNHDGTGGDDYVQDFIVESYYNTDVLNLLGIGENQTASHALLPSLNITDWENVQYEVRIDAGDFEGIVENDSLKITGKNDYTGAASGAVIAKSQEGEVLGELAFNTEFTNIRNASATLTDPITSTPYEGIIIRVTNNSGVETARDTSGADGNFSVQVVGANSNIEFTSDRTIPLTYPIANNGNDDIQLYTFPGQPGIVYLHHKDYPLDVLLVTQDASINAPPSENDLTHITHWARGSFDYGHAWTFYRDVDWGKLIENVNEFNSRAAVMGKSYPLPDSSESGNVVWLDPVTQASQEAAILDSLRADPQIDIINWITKYAQPLNAWDGRPGSPNGPHEASSGFVVSPEDLNTMTFIGERWPFITGLHISANGVPGYEDTPWGQGVDAGGDRPYNNQMRNKSMILVRGHEALPAGTEARLSGFTYLTDQR